VILLLVFGWGQIPQRFQQTLRVEPGDPLEGRVLDVVEATPGPGLQRATGIVSRFSCFQTFFAP